MNQLPPMWRWQTLPLAQRHRLPATSGIYALTWGRNIYYIGRAKNLSSRWRGENHHRYYIARLVPGLKLQYTEAPRRKLPLLESQAISRYDPAWNYTPSPGKGLVGALIWHCQGHSHCDKPPTDWVAIALRGAIVFAMWLALGPAPPLNPSTTSPPPQLRPAPNPQTATPRPSGD